MEKEQVERKPRSTKIGIVVSNKMDKTVVVAVVDNVKHPLYKKVVKVTKKFKADDQIGCGIGDTVEIMQTRLLSKTKYFRVVRIVEKAR